MKTYINYYAIAALILLLASCSKDNDLQTNEIGDDANLLKSAEIKQFKIISASGVLAFGPSAMCTNSVQNRNSGTGTASHFGKFTIESAYCVNEALPGGFGSAWSGKITTANGDVIYFKNDDPAKKCTLDPTNNWKAHVEYNIVGGTGKYEGAKGFLYMDGSVNVPNLEWEVVGGGTINYKKCKKAGD